MNTEKKYFKSRYCLVLREKIISVAIILFISSFLGLLSCTQPLVFKSISANESGYFMFGKIPERSFYQNVSISPDIQLKWSVETSGSQSNSSIVIYKDILFVTDLSGKIYGFDRVTGKLLGYEKYPGSIPVAPVINGLRMFFIVNNLNERFSTIKNYDLVGGKILNESKIAGGVQNEMLKLADGIIVLSDNGELIKYNLVGSKEWTILTKVKTKSSPASDGKLIFFGNENGEIIAISALDGSVKYRKKISSGIAGNSSFDGQNVYLGCNEGNLFSVNADDGIINWKFNTKTKILATPVFDSDKIIVGNLAGEIFCVNKKDGSLIWKTDANGIVNTTPLLLNNILIQPVVNKKICLIDTHSGKIVKAYEYESRIKLSPVLYDGILYLGSDKGQIDAYTTSPKN